jgi:FAD-dependent oxidoreductase domain-containing protein 1
MDKVFDVIIIGGGIMGSASAYFLMKYDDTLKVAVVERDPTYTHASTTLSASNVRIQFSLKENIQISQFASEFLERFEDEMEVESNKPKIYFQREGNLFLKDQADRKETEEALALQKNLGCQVEWWSPDKIEQQYPLYETKGFVGATFGPQDGHLDSYATLMGFKAKARSLGAEYIKAEVVEILTTHESVAGVKLASQDNLSAKFVVNCAGPWAAEVAQTANVNLPVIPVKRQIYILDTAVKPETPLPLTFLPSGLYFRSETGGLILLGKSFDDDPVGFDFTWDDKRFLEILWPDLAQFVPSFDRLKLVRGWAGLYAVNTIDGNAILGEWPEVNGLFLANGFSGHGFQQAPAVGRYLSELILSRPPLLDLSVFKPERILENKPLSEGGMY